MKRKRRKVQLAQPGERRQYAPGALVQSIDPDVRDTMEYLAGRGYAEHGRSLLIVEISDAEPTDIISSKYIGMAQIAEMNQHFPFAEAQPGAEALKHYDPEREFVAFVVDVTPRCPARSSGLTCFHVRAL